MDGPNVYKISSGILNTFQRKQSPLLVLLAVVLYTTSIEVLQLEQKYLNGNHKRF